jgi:hypothetical protein
MITIQGGSYQNADGTRIAGGKLVLQLSHDARTKTTPSHVVYAFQKIIILDASGNAPATQIYSNAELDPDGTCYNVNLFSAAGAHLWARQQAWVFSQDAGSTVDLATLTPASGGGFPSYSGAVLTNPSAAQTIAGHSLAVPAGITAPLTGSVIGSVQGDIVSAGTSDFNNLSASTAAIDTLTVTNPIEADVQGDITAQYVNAIAFADQFAGATPGDKIWAAHNAVETAGGGLVVVPSSLAAGESPNQFHDGVLVLDLRGTAQSQGLRFNVPVLGADTVRSKVFLQDNFSADTVGLNPSNHSCTHYVLSYVDKPEQTNGTIAAANATLAVNSQQGDSTGPLIGGEFSANVNATNGTPRTCADIRGLLGNAAVGGNTSVTQAVSVYGQAITNTGSGTVTDAISVKAEKQTVATGANLSVWALGKSKFEEPIGVGASPQNGTAVFVRPSALTGGTQIGAQFAPLSTSAANATGEGIRVRCDTENAAYTQALNMGISVENPSKGAASTITKAVGIRIADIVSGATNFAIETLGAAKSLFTGGIRCPLTTPASGTAAGTAGDIAWDANYVYVCTATNTWKRSALTAF